MKSATWRRRSALTLWSTCVPVDSDRSTTKTLVSQIQIKRRMVSV